jgi:hypothetical protein
MVKAILIGGAGLVLVLVVMFFGLGYLLSDEKGLSVPTTLAGNTCWLTKKGIDVLDCLKSEQGQDFFVHWKDRWWGVSKCQTEEAARVFRCRLPYPLRIDLTGDYPKVTADLGSM